MYPILDLQIIHICNLEYSVYDMSARVPCCSFYSMQVLTLGNVRLRRRGKISAIHLTFHYHASDPRQVEMKLPAGGDRHKPPPTEAKRTIVSYDPLHRRGGVASGGGRGRARPALPQRYSGT